MVEEEGGVDVWQARKGLWRGAAFEISSKRRKGFPSETQVKRGYRVINDGKELVEKLGRNDLCPCHSGRRFQELLYDFRSV
ncbi:MAG: hypothetical protein CAF43_008870 [Nitrospira sp. CG24C]|nr:MAG: hypothetical protein CAF43_008870 [Nitrospira sp. CG24C]